MTSTEPDEDLDAAYTAVREGLLRYVLGSVPDVLDDRFQEVLKEFVDDVLDRKLSAGKPPKRSPGNDEPPLPYPWFRLPRSPDETSWTKFEFKGESYLIYASPDGNRMWALEDDSAMRELTRYTIPAELIHGKAAPL